MNLSRFRQRLHRGLGHFLAALLFVMVANVLWQVASRYLLGRPSPITEELSRFLLVWLGLLGGAYAANYGDHIALDLLPLPTAWRARIQRLSIISLGALLAIGGLRLVQFLGTMDQRSAALGIPLAWVYLAAPIAGLLMIVLAPTGSENATSETSSPAEHES